MSRQPYVYTMPESFLKDKSVPARWRVLGVINGFIINGGCFYGSNEWLMEQLGCTEPTISAAFAELEKLNLIEVRRTARSRKVYRKAHDPNQLGSETQTEPVHDPSQLGPNSVSNSEKNTGALEDELRVEKVLESDEERPKRQRKVTKEMQAVFDVFDDNPARKVWKLHEVQRESAATLFEEYGVDEVRNRYTVARAYRGSDMCPLINTPLDLLTKMPNMENFLKSLQS